MVVVGCLCSNGSVTCVFVSVQMHFVGRICALRGSRVVRGFVPSTRTDSHISTTLVGDD